MKDGKIMSTVTTICYIITATNVFLNKQKPIEVKGTQFDVHLSPLFDEDSI